MRPRSTAARGRFGWLATYLVSAIVVASSLVAVSQAPAHAVGQQVFNGFDGSVNAMAQGADGTTYVGGEFTGWGPQTGGGAVVNATSAQVVSNFPSVNGIVHAATSDGVGGWYIGGFFSSVGGVPRRNAAHILPTGAINPNWNPNPDSTVFRILVLRGVVYLGGEFTSVCGTGSSCGDTATRTGAAAFNPDGTITPWNPRLSGVLAMAASDDASTIYLGGRFTLACGAGSSCGETQVSRPNLAAVRTDGTLVAGWNPSVSIGAGALPSSIQAIAILGTTVYVGGDFTKICGFGSSCGDTVQNRGRAAAINTDGTLSDTWKPVVSGGYPAVSDLVVSPDGSTVYLGGDFTSIDAVARGHAGAVTAGGTLTDWNPNLSARVWGLALAGTTMYVAGEFTTACGVAASSCGDVVTRNRLAAFGTDGGVLAWNPNVNGAAREVTQMGSVVYTGGAFTSMVTQARNRLAAVDANGALTSWNPNANGTVSALAVSGSTVYAGGSFTTVGGQTRTRLAAIGTDGILADWNPVANGTVSALAVDGSTVYVGGAFTGVCGTGSTCGGTQVTRNRAAAFNSDGTLVAAWNPSFNGSVNAMAVADGIVYVGGAYTAACGEGSSCGESSVTRNRAAAFNAAGAIQSWNPNLLGPAGVSVNALAISGTTVYLGGFFPSVGGQSRSRLASVSTDTGAVTTWNPNAAGNVNALAISGSTLYVGGAFSTISSISRSRLAAFNIADPTPSLVATWTPVAGGLVSALVANTTSVLAGGSFTTATGTINGSVQTARFAVFPASGLAESPTGVTATRGNASAAVIWAAPTNVGSGITGYRLESAPGPNYDTWTIRVANTGSAATSATVTGLVNGTNYRIRVTSLTSAGAGGRSIPSQWFSPVAPSATPAVPTGLTGIPGNGKITASWNPVIDVGVGATFINRYRTFALAGATAVSVCNTTGTLATPPATTCELTGLTNGQSFTLTTRSFNNLNKFSDLSPTEGPYTPSN